MSGAAVERLGERIGIGRTAEVFAWRDGEILKLLRPGFPERMGEREAAIAARVTAAQLAAPRFLGLERVDGRLGLRYERVSGPSMLDRLTGRPWLTDELARRFAALHARMHATDGTGLPDHAAAVRSAILHVAAELGPARGAAALDRFERLSVGSVVCHGDMHPGNVIMTTASDPIVIDWLTAGAGPPEADVARTLFLLRDSAIPDSYARLQRVVIEAVRRRFASRYLRAYRRLRPIDDRQLRLWRLAVLAARLAEGIAEERDVLLARIDAELARSAP